MKQIFPRALLGVSGLLLLIIGGAVLFYPVVFAAANGIVLPDAPSLLSEYRAPGGLLIASGVLILLGAVRSVMLEVEPSIKSKCWLVGKSR